MQVNPPHTLYTLLSSSIPQPRTREGSKHAERSTADIVSEQAGEHEGLH